MSEFVLTNNALDIPQIYAKWYEFAKDKNCGALLTFCGIVREEEGIE
ncbi:molybdenum cofactor biosynthesis protein MoaE, partial [Campylobacter coli]